MMPSETLISHSNPSPSSSPSPSHPDHSTLTQPIIMTHSSNWLQRLRSSRGFPDSHHINLEHFLSTSQPSTHSTLTYNNHPQHLHNNNTNNINTTTTTTITTNNSNINKALKGRDLINNVLSDLFYMGNCQDHSIANTNTTCNTRGRSRKQLCPRICVVSTDSGVPKDRFCSGGGGKVKEVNEVVECGEGGEERGGWDFSGYSQTEVTVIDTSVACWKFEKVLYRKKNVWKVGDRKGKGLMSGDRNRKKRKERGNESGGGGGDLPKKKLKKKLKLKLCSSLKYADKEGSVGLSKSDQGHDQGKVVARNEKKRDNCSQVQEKSFCKKQIEEGSSVILIKSIPTTSKKNVSGVSNNCLKSSQR